MYRDAIIVITATKAWYVINFRVIRPMFLSQRRLAALFVSYLRAVSVFEVRQHDS